jgi:signal transduction histidine kinase
MKPPDETFFLRKPFRFEPNPFNSLLTAILADAAYEIVHELRTSSAAVRGYTRMMLEGRAGPLNDTAKAYLEIIDRNNRTSTDLCQKMWILIAGQKSQNTSSVGEILSLAVKDIEYMLGSGVHMQSTCEGAAAHVKVPSIALYALFKGILLQLLGICRQVQQEDIEFRFKLRETRPEIEFTITIHGCRLRPGELYDRLSSQEGSDFKLSVPCAVMDLYSHSPIEIRAHDLEPIVALRLPCE